jgi:hypothetical protein
MFDDDMGQLYARTERRTNSKRSHAVCAPVERKVMQHFVLRICGRNTSLAQVSRNPFDNAVATLEWCHCNWGKPACAALESDAAPIPNFAAIGLA